MKVKVRTRLRGAYYAQLLSFPCNLHRADSNGSASYRPPRFDSLGVEGLNESKVNGSGTSFANTSSPVRAEALKAQEPQRLDDELPPPTLSAPPASIPFVASQNEPVITVSAGSATDAETSGKIDNDSAGSNMAVFGTVPEEKNPLFQFGFSQMPGVLQSSTGEAGDTSMSQANNSDEQQFALNFSQMVDTQAMTQA